MRPLPRVSEGTAIIGSIYARKFMRVATLTGFLCTWVSVNEGGLGLKGHGEGVHELNRALREVPAEEGAIAVRREGDHVSVR